MRLETSDQADFLDTHVATRTIPTAKEPKRRHGWKKAKAILLTSAKKAKRGLSWRTVMLVLLFLTLLSCLIPAMNAFSWCLTLLLIFSVISLTRKSGAITQSEPSCSLDVKNSRTVPRSKDEVWCTLVPALAKSFFQVNNMERDSGFINVSYAGEPDGIIDGGRITSIVRNSFNEKTYSFPAATAYIEYDAVLRGTHYHIKKVMRLEGRINIAVEAVHPLETLITVHTLYELTQNTEMRSKSASDPIANSHTILFSTGSEAMMHGNTEPFRSTGKLEAAILELV